MSINPENIDTITIPELDTVALALTNLFAHSAPNGKLGKASVNDLAVFIAPYVSSVGSSGYIETESTDTLPTPLGDGPFFTLTGNGIFGGTTASGDINLWSFVDGNWHLTKEININLDDYVTDIELKKDLFSKIMPITFNPLSEGFEPEVVPFGMADAVSNMPYSEGSAIRIPIGAAANPSYVFSIYQWQNDLFKIRGKSLKFQFIIEGNIEISVDNFVSSVRPVQPDTSYVGVNATEILQISPTRIMFTCECIVGANDVYYNALFQFVGAGGDITYPSELTVKTVSTSVNVINEGTDQSYTLKKIITDQVNAELKPIRQMMRDYAPFLAVFGTSQERGINNGDPGTYPYITPAADSYRPGESAYRHLKPEYYWLNLFNEADGKNLEVKQFAVGGSRISWAGGAGVRGFNDDMSHFNMMSNLDPEWSGIAIMGMGWNNNIKSIYANLAEATTDADIALYTKQITDWFSVFKTSVMACIARALIDDYAGIAWVGWDRAGNQDANGWQRTGLNTGGRSSDGSNNTQTLPDQNNSIFSPFRRTGAPNAPRYFTRLQPGQYVEFTLANKRAIALFLETGSDYAGIGTSRGAKYRVTVNGSAFGDYTTDYTNPAIPTDFHPIVNWLENVTQDLPEGMAPQSTTVRVTNIDVQVGDVVPVVRFLAYGWIDKQADSIIDKKMIIVGSTSGNPFGHSMAQLKGFADASRDAVACFNEYPGVVFAHVTEGYVANTDQQPDDVSHNTAIGNQHMAETYLNKCEKPPLGESRNMIKDFN